MKLLIATPYFYPKIGGVENYTYNIAKGLKKKYNWEILIVTSSNENKIVTSEYIDDIKIYKLPFLFKLSNTPINLFWLFYLKKIIQSEKPDVINGHSPVPFMADMAFLASGNTPFVLTYQSGDMLKGGSVFNPIIFLYQKIFLAYIFKRSNRIISYHPGFIKRELSSYKDKVGFIPPGVDHKVFFPDTSVKKTNDILYVGRIEKSSEWKGVVYLINAVKIVKKTFPNIRLTLVGSGDQVSEFKNYSREIGIEKNVFFVGQKSGRDLVREYQRSKMLVLPSTSDSESFGIVLIEAMACGLPVIGTNIGGIPYVIKNNQNGLIVEPRDSKEIANAVINAYKKLTKKTDDVIFTKNKEFSWTKQIQKTNKFLTNLIG